MKEEGKGDLHDYQDVAENYDRYVAALLGGDDRQFIQFHLELAEQFGQQGILDCACGTGVTLLPLAEQGYRVVGLDISEPMIRIVERKLMERPEEVRKRVGLMVANMTSFQLEEPVSLMIIPRSGYMHLLTPEDQEQCLRSIADNLTPGGVLSFNTFDPDYAVIGANLSGTLPEPSVRVEYINAAGQRERILNVTTYDPARQILDGVWIFEALAETGEVLERRQRPLRMRWTFESEMRHLLRLCGFEVMELYGGYDRVPTSYGGQRVWVVKKRHLGS